MLFRSLPSRPALGPTDHPAAARPLPSAPPAMGGLSREAISALRLPRPPRSSVDTQPPRAQPGLHAVWVSGPCRRLSGCPSSSLPSPGTYPAALRASPAARLLRGRSQSARRRRWCPSPPSGAGGAAAAASRGTPELPRAPSARLAELLAPRANPSCWRQRAEGESQSRA